MDIQNQNVDKRQYEKRFLRFLMKIIKQEGGSIKCQHISGHFSQLSPDMRNALGTSKSDLFKFLEKHTDTFIISNDTVSLNTESYDDDNIDTTSLPKKISKGKGVIVKLLSNCGFIKSRDPIKTEVFFYDYRFDYGKNINFADYGINIGTMVYFDAVQQIHKKFSTQYHAVKVWKMDKVDNEIGKVDIIYQPRKSRETGIYDPIDLKGQGVIHKVFPTHGFISANGEEKNSVFFYKNRVVNYNNIVDLTQVFTCGDLVEFDAHRTTKQDARARWEATRVWKKSGMSVAKKKTAISKSNSESSFISSVTSESPSAITAALKNSESLTLPGFHSNSITAKEGARQKGPSNEMIYNQVGKICPRSSNSAVIKFGENFTQLADGDSSTYYISGTEVTEISWMFSEDDDVKFDAVKIKSAPGWKAVLVWTGDKPNIVVSPYLGDFSEFSDEIEDVAEDAESSVSGLPLSLSSHSSLKSVSMKSESSEFKSNRSGKESSRVADSPVSTDRKTSNKGFKVRNLCSPPSHCSSQSNLSSKELKIHEESKKLRNGNSDESKFEIDKEKPALKCRNDTESAKHILNASSSKHNDVDDLRDIQSEMVFRKSNYSTNMNKVDSDAFAKLSEESKISNDLKNDAVNLECYEILGKLTHSALVNNNKASDTFTESSEESEIDDDLKNNGVVLECDDIEVKKAAGIKIYKNNVGKVTKIYSTFAELYASDLEISVSFLWSVFYCNQKSMEDQDINDLREVLKVGATVKFNYFEIVDDSGQSWQKVPLAWRGTKPAKFNEMSPLDFIHQNALSVTVNELNCEQYEENVKKIVIPRDTSPCNNHKDSNNVQIEKTVKKFLIPCDVNPYNNYEESNNVQAEKAVKKFLIPCDKESHSNEDEDSNNVHSEEPIKKFIVSHKLDVDDKDVKCASQSESCSDDDYQTFYSPLSFFKEEKSYSEFQSLSDVISQKLQMNINLILDNKVDLNALSVEIVNLVLDQCSNKESSLNLVKRNCVNDNLGSGTSDVTCSTCGKNVTNNSSSQNVNMKNTEVQTIFTGEVMASNIYTEC